MLVLRLLVPLILEQGDEDSGIGDESREQNVKGCEK